MKWLVRMDVDAGVARSEGIFDSYAWHKKLWECFPDAPDAKRDFLTRIDQRESAYRLWLLAKRKPVCPSWCPGEEFAIKEIAPPFLSHRYYAFDLLANPTKRISQQDVKGGRKRQGKRIPLVKPDELKSWLIRKGKVRCRDNISGGDVAGGFRLVENRPLDISPMIESHFRKKGHRGYHGGVQFRGILEVTDPARFTETYQSGLGSAKSFGFGLLLLAPINL